MRSLPTPHWAKCDMTRCVTTRIENCQSILIARRRGNRFHRFPERLHCFDLPSHEIGGNEVALAIPGINFLGSPRNVLPYFESFSNPRKETERAKTDNSCVPKTVLSRTLTSGLCFVPRQSLAALGLPGFLEQHHTSSPPLFFDRGQSF
jgi:hypothetical protein